MSKSFGYKLKYNTSQKLLDGTLSVINFFTPSPKFTKKSKYVSENFLAGTGELTFTPNQNAKWHLGFAVASLLTGNELDGNHFVGGEMRGGRKTATEIYDDMRVRAIAINDGTGGTVIFAALDLYGLANNEVRVIRSRLAEFAKENNIVSINLFTLHQHSVVDTLGMNGELKEAFLRNPKRNLLRKGGNKNGKNPDFMKNLYNVTAETIKEAVRNLEPGKMVFGSVDASPYVNDQRPPYVNDTNLNRLRFIPDNPDSRSTWIVNWCTHCGGNGSSNRQITSDYPYYMEKEISERENANFIMILGAIQSNAMRKSAELLNLPKEHTPIDIMKAYAHAFVELLLSIPEEEETDVEPLLNIRHKEIFLPLKNKIMILAFNVGLFQNSVVKKGTKLFLVSEIGIASFGNNITVALVPGELEPSLAYGGTVTAAESWSGKDWTMPSIHDMVGRDKKLLVFGLANDQVGYIVADTDFVPILAPESVHVEIVSLSKKCASTLLTSIQSLADEKH